MACINLKPPLTERKVAAAPHRQEQVGGNQQ